MAAAITGRNGGIDIGAPQALFRMPPLVAEGRLLMPTSNSYLAVPNGQRFLAAVSASDPQPPPLNVVVNWQQP